jgi:hypothetical protein
MGEGNWFWSSFVHAELQAAKRINCLVDQPCQLEEESSGGWWENILN